MIAVMDGLRLSIRLPFFIAFLLMCVATILLLRLADPLLPRPIDRAPLAKLYLAGLCRLLGFTLRRHGTPVTEAALLVCNHVSWTDIVVLGACAPLRFLSKSEVAHWPVIGWIARDIGTLFIERAGGKAAEVRAQVAAALEEDARVLVFPEGTTTDGSQVSPFRGRLLTAATVAGKPIQAVTLAYQREGAVDTLVPFVGDDCFQHHLVRLLKKPAVIVDVVFHPPTLPAAQTNSQQLAQLLQRQVSQGLEALRMDGCSDPASASLRL